MKKTVVSMTLVVAALLSESDASATSFLELKETSYSLGYTYREDSLSWNYAGPGGNPNILSELEWKELRINQITFATHLITCCNVYFRGYADYGRIYHGKNSDVDYEEDNRQEEFSRATANSGKGEVFDLSAGLGYQWTWCCERVRLAPLVGLSWHEQHLRIYDGIDYIPIVEDIDNLHSSYKTRWWGPWVGADFIGTLTCNFTIFGSVEYHWASYQGAGHWNLREDILSDFKHNSYAHGFISQGGVNYNFCGNWSLTLLAGYQDWRANGGKHRALITNIDDEIVPFKTKLNKVSWHSFQATALITYSY